MASENVSKTVSLKDYIIDMQSAAVKGSAQYEVVLENNTDFIIKRRTATTDRELVILVSKGLYYIKDCKTGHIEELKEQSLNTFLRELKDGMVALHEVHWLSNLYRESVGLIMQVITDETLTDMCRHNVLVNTFDPTWYTRYWKQNSKLFIRLYNMFPSMADRKKYQASIPVIFWIEEQYGAMRPCSLPKSSSSPGSWRWILTKMVIPTMNVRFRTIRAGFSTSWHRPTASICAGSSTTFCLTCMPRDMPA